MNKPAQHLDTKFGCQGYLWKGPEGWVLVDAPREVTQWVLARIPDGEKLTDLLITHQHYDHVLEAARLKEATGCRIHAALPFSTENTLELAGYGCPAVPPFQVDDIVGMSGVQKRNLAGEEWTIYPIPGHARDSLVYHLPERGFLFTGDVLFPGDVGRTDFPGSTTEAELVEGIRKYILTLPPETVVFAGHGYYTTTVQKETLYNRHL